MKYVIAIDKNNQIDYDYFYQLKEILQKYEEKISYLKFNSLFYNENVFNFFRFLKKRPKIWLDLKIYDTPNTIKNTIREVSKYCQAISVTYGNRNENSIEAALEEGRKRNVKIIIVTSLTTSFSTLLEREILINDCYQLGVKSLVLPYDLVKYSKYRFEYFIPSIITSNIKGYDNLNSINLDNLDKNKVNHLILGRTLYQEFKNKNLKNFFKKEI